MASLFCVYVGVLSRIPVKKSEQLFAVSRFLCSHVTENTCHGVTVVAL